MQYVDVFDFDHTIYKGDVTIDFYRYCLKRHPQLIKYLPNQIYAGIAYALKKTTLNVFKHQFFCFLVSIKDIDLEVENFWRIHKKNIKDWYYMRNKSCDIIISASPYFLLAPIIAEMHAFGLIATGIDPNTAQFLTPNCKGEEKVRRFFETYGKTKIRQFYSDSISDLPLAKLAEESFIVNGKKMKRWFF